MGIGRGNVIDLGKNIGGGGDSGAETGSAEIIGINLHELEQHLKAAAAPGSGTAAVVSLSFGEVNTVSAHYIMTEGRQGQNVNRVIEISPL